MEHLEYIIGAEVFKRELDTNYDSRVKLKTYTISGYNYPVHDFFGLILPILFMLDL